MDRKENLGDGWCLEYHAFGPVASEAGIDIGYEGRWVRIKKEGPLNVRMKDIKGLQKIHPQCTFRLVHAQTDNFIMGDAV